MPSIEEMGDAQAVVPKIPTLEGMEGLDQPPPIPDSAQPQPGRRNKQQAPVELWVKAGSDGTRNGADPLCQQFFMILFIKGDQRIVGNSMTFNVKTVNPAKPHSEFRDCGLRHTPAMVHGEEMMAEHPDEILEYIDTAFPVPPLQYFDPDADVATRNLFSKFCFYIKEVNKDPKGLEAELKKLDAFLEESETRFLTGNNPSHLDCRILPYLQHIRVAGPALKNYSIPTNLRHLWHYLEAAYELEAFVKSCPSDQEIILHWAERKDTPNLPPNKISELTRQTPTFTMTIPPYK